MFKCNICEKEFEKGRSYAAHMSHHSVLAVEIKKNLDIIKVEKECIICNKKFTVTRTVNKKEVPNISKDEKKCCSRRCANSIGGKAPKGEKEIFCKKCGCLFKTDVRATANNSRCFICRETPRKQYEKGTEKEYTCISCGIVFFSKTKGRRCCSLSCAGKASAAIQIKRSKNEIYFSELCKTEFSNVLTNNKLFNGWDADVIIEDLKIAILWNGKWHYEKIKEKHSLLQVQNRDNIKLKEIEKAGYTYYIIKDMGKHNKKFVQEQFNLFIKYCSTHPYQLK